MTKIKSSKKPRIKLLFFTTFCLKQNSLFDNQYLIIVLFLLNSTSLYILRFVVLSKINST